MKNTRLMKRFGSTKTNLELSALAQQVYDSTDPLSIFEEEVEPEDEDGECEYRYSMRGAFGDYDGLTEAVVNEMLEANETLYYFPNEEYVDQIFGNLYPYCLTAEEVRRLSAEWDCDLFDQVHEASADEIAMYGTEAEQ